MAKKQEGKGGSDEPEVGTLERHYRVTLDFRLLAREITPELCRESFFFNDEKYEAGGTDFQEIVERQRRLYALLRKNRRVLERYLLSVLTQEAGSFVHDGLVEAFGAGDEVELLVPLYKGMAEEDVRFFDKCRQEESLDANTDLIATAFKVEWVGTEVVEMSWRVEGDVKRAEVVEQTRTRMIRKLSSRD